MLYSILSLLALLQLASGLNVAVTGPTGRTGRMVVNKLLSEGHSVTAIMRNTTKAMEVLPASEKLACTTLDLATADGAAMREACAGSDAIIWAATGFSDAGESLDVRGMQTLLPAAFEATDDGAAAPPKVVLLSSAGVTRPAWDEQKKERLVGAADIPIIRLNPGGILGKKCEAEQHLRESGLGYCVVRPTGLKFEGWPQGRPVLSQGDVAVGRTNPLDLASVLVSVLNEPAARGKTFEMFTLAGYPAPRELAPVLEGLVPDAAMPLDEAAVDATYATLQQFLPGEEQDATKLEMGRTYEQVDAGEVAARERGAAPTAREMEMASGVVEATGGGKRQAVRGLFSRLLKK